LEEKSTPTVTAVESENLSWMKRRKRLDFPTPDLPSMTTATTPRRDHTPTPYVKYSGAKGAKGHAVWQRSFNTVAVLRDNTSARVRCRTATSRNRSRTQETLPHTPAKSLAMDAVPRHTLPTRKPQAAGRTWDDTAPAPAHPNSRLNAKSQSDANVGISSSMFQRYQQSKRAHS
jgi:hypothetical protein